MLQTNNNAPGDPGPGGGGAGSSGATPSSATQDSTLGLAAASYAARGWPVFPLRPGGKEPLTPHGFKDATTDPEAIAEWWRRWPEANVGIVTGTPSGIAVLDIDPRNGGDESLRDLEARYGPLPDTPTALTGGGGQHFFLAIPPGVTVRSRRVAPGVDLKGEGAYVAAVPSAHPSGRRYVWELGRSPDDLPLAPLPAWLLEGDDGQREWRWDGEPVPQGRRHNHLTSLAGRLRADGLSPAAIEAALLVENERRCQPPLPEREVRAIARSMGNYPPHPNLPSNGSPAAPPAEMNETKPGEAEGFVSSHIKGGSWKETNFVGADQLLASPETHTEWLLPGYLPKGGICLVSSRPKLGKSTLAGYILKALLEGGNVIGREAVRVDKAAWFAEESASLLAHRLHALNLGTDRLLVALRHQARRPLPELVAEAIELGVQVIVVDTLSAWAGVEDENSATEVEKALRPIVSLAQERGVAILLLHHLNKSDGPEGTAHRGSGHLVAMADVAVELRRPEGHAPATRRVLKSLSRYQETPQELVIELQEGGYEALGTGEQVIMRQAEEALLDILPGPAEEAIPFEGGADDTIMGRMKEAKLPRTTLHRALASLVERGLVERLGGGKRGDPYRFRLAGGKSFPSNSQVLMEGNKSQAATCPRCGGPTEALKGRGKSQCQSCLLLLPSALAPPLTHESLSLAADDESSHDGLEEVV